MRLVKSFHPLQSEFKFLFFLFLFFFCKKKSRSRIFGQRERLRERSVRPRTKLMPAYAKNLKKTETCLFSQNFDLELINYSGMWPYTDMRFFAKVPQCNSVRCPPRRGASRPSKKFSAGKFLEGCLAPLPR